MDNYNDVKMGMRKLNVAISVAGEKKKGYGEDSYSYTFNDKGGFIGVFDGFGKSVIYPELCNKTSCYFASHLAADIALQMFKYGNFTFSEMDSIKLGSDMKKYIEKLNKSIDSDERFNLPTTASIVACDYSDNENIFLEYLWAGNSRGYLLDRQGLCQITEDDLVEKTEPVGEDDNDRVINLINGETEFKINNKMLRTSYPVTVVTATEGAFKCFSTPMEFEYALLYTLNRAKSVAQWESLLTRLIGEFAKDDFSLMIASFGFDDFKDLKHYYFERTKFVFDEYISPMSQADEESTDDVVKELWNKYKESYYR